MKLFSSTLHQSFILNKSPGSERLNDFALFLVLTDFVVPGIRLIPTLSAVPGNDNGSEDETDIIPGPLSFFRLMPGKSVSSSDPLSFLNRKNPFHPPIRCHF